MIQTASRRVQGEGKGEGPGRTSGSETLRTCSWLVQLCRLLLLLLSSACCSFSLGGVCLRARSEGTPLVPRCFRVERRLQSLLDALLLQPILTLIFTRARSRALGVRPLHSFLAAPIVELSIQCLSLASCDILWIKLQCTVYGILEKSSEKSGMRQVRRSQAPVQRATTTVVDDQPSSCRTPQQLNTYCATSTTGASAQRTITGESARAYTNERPAWPTIHIRRRIEEDR